MPDAQSRRPRDLEPHEITELRSGLADRQKQLGWDLAVNEIVAWLKDDANRVDERAGDDIARDIAVTFVALPGQEREDSRG